MNKMAILLAASALAHPRAIVGAVRADASDPKAMLDELNKAWAAFKDEHTAEVAAIKKGMGDYVQSEKVDRINTAVGDMQKAIDELALKQAAMADAGGGGDTPKMTAEQRVYAQGFERFFRSGVDAGLGEMAVKAELVTQSDPDGGYLVPHEMESAIDRVLGTVSIMRQIATVRSISAASFKKPVSLGGATSGWVGETSTRSETNTPRLSVLEFTPGEIYAEPHATQTLLDDASVNLEQWLADEVAIEFAEEEGNAFVNGNGVNKPKGLLSYSTVANASYAWGKLGFIASGAAADFATEDPGDAIIDLIHALKSGYRQGASFLMNDLVLAKVRKFKDDQDNYLWAPGLQAGVPPQLLGYPVRTDDNMPDVAANAFPVAFGDFRRGYLIVDRIGTRVLRDAYTAKPYVKFYTTKRVGGGVQNFEAVKLLKCST